MDAVMYCLAALERFAEMPEADVRAVVAEIATVGQRGLDVNNPEHTYRLRSLPGARSPLSSRVTTSLGCWRGTVTSRRARFASSGPRQKSRRPEPWHHARVLVMEVVAAAPVGAVVSCEQRSCPQLHSGSTVGRQA